MLREFLIKASIVGVHLDIAIAQKLLDYLDLLRKWNRVHNLCADASYEKMLAYHVLDSISVAGVINLKNKLCLDVGTGAGLPGLLLAIVEPECKMVLLDSKEKKMTFVKHAINVLGVTNVVTVSGRIEKFNAEQPFDIILSRAFASLPKFVECSQKLCAEDGMLVAMKSSLENYNKNSYIGNLMRVLEVFDIAVPGVTAKRMLIILGKNHNKNAIFNKQNLN